MRKRAKSRPLDGLVRLKNQLSEIIGALQIRRGYRDVDGHIRWNKVEAAMHAAVDEMARANNGVTGAGGAP